MQKVEIIINEKKVSYWQGGQGTPLFLIHGGIGNAELHWKHVWNQLAERYTVIAPNLPSFSGTSPLERAGFAQIADWLVSLMDALKIESANVIGNSFGGWSQRFDGKQARAESEALDPRQWRCDSKHPAVRGAYDAVIHFQWHVQHDPQADVFFQRSCANVCG